MNENANSKTYKQIVIDPNPFSFFDVDPQELEQKLKNKQKTALFFAKNGEYFPQQSCFDFQFALDVFAEEKKLLNSAPDPALSMPLFKKNKILTTEYIFQKCLGKAHIMKYFPENIKPAYIKRDFLFSVIFESDKILYDYLLKEKNKEELKRQKPTFRDMSIRISNKYKNKLQEFEKLTGNIYFFIFLDYENKVTNTYFKSKKKGRMLRNLKKK